MKIVFQTIFIVFYDLYSVLLPGLGELFLLYHQSIASFPNHRLRLGSYRIFNVCNLSPSVAFCNELCAFLFVSQGFVDENEVKIVVACCA